jgi:hypothetical protein
MVKEKWIWDNIMDIYLKMGKDYTHNDDIIIVSHDDYFRIYLNDQVHRFKISIQHSLFSETRYLFECENDLDIDFYVERLKPIFREYKLKELL